MKQIVLDLTDCLSKDDFNEAAAIALQAPSWHGRNLDAWWDSIRSDDINDVRAPYTVVIKGAERLSPDARRYVIRFAALIDEAREEGVDVRCLFEASNNSN